MTNEKSESKPRKPSAKARRSSARLLAVQAIYQSSMNEQGLTDVAKEYLDHRIGMEVEGEEIVEADKQLFGKIINGVSERKDDLGHVIQSNINFDSSNTETLIKAVLMCAGYELLVHQDIDKPIIINDYLNVGHAFFPEKEVGMLNAILDSISKALDSN